MNTLPMTVIQRSKQKGLTLLETVLALAVGMIIIMAVLVYYQTASDNANMTATIKIAGNIGSAVRAYAQTPAYKGDITIDLAKLQAAGLLTSADTVNPWSIQANSLVVTTNGNYLGINFYNVPATTNTAITSGNKAGGICASLATQLSNALPLPSPGTVTVSGTTYKYSGTYTIDNPSTGGVTGTSTTGTNPKSKTAQGAAVCQYTSGAATGTLTVIMDLS